MGILLLFTFVAISFIISLVLPDEKEYEGYSEEDYKS